MKSGKEQAFVFEKITAIEAIPYDGPVYNLQVRGPECYIAEGIVVHNCPHTGKAITDRKLSRRECQELWMG